MAKLVLTDTATLQEIIAAINANNAALEAFAEKVLSRDGTSPNAMEADLDMNSRRVFNLPAPASATEPLRVQETLGVGVSVPPTTPFSLTLLDDANASEARLTLGLGDNSISNSMIIDNAVTTTKILDSNVTTAKIADNNVTNAKLADMAAALIKGRASGAGTGDPTDLTAAQVLTILGYQEGSFTPSITFGGGSTGITYSAQVGRYIAMSNIVEMWGAIILTNKGSSTGTLVINGFPFTTSNIANLEYPGHCRLLNTASDNFSARTSMATNSNTAVIRITTGAASFVADNTTMNNNSQIFFHITVRIN